MDGHLPENQKNNSVELLRFLFTSIIIFFHINLDLWDQKKVVAVIGKIPVTFFQHGNIGVEFFFLVTGWLMAKSIYTRYVLPEKSEKSGRSTGPVSRERNSLPAETVQFVMHKAKAVFPCYLLACALTPVMRLMTDRTLTVSYFVRRLPSLFFLQRIGIGKPFIGCTWYLSSMLLALLIVYPLCRRFYHAYTLFAAPVIGAVLLSAIIICTGSLGEIEDWFFFTYKTNVRAFAEISMGTTAFEISRRLQGRVRSLPVRILLSTIALTCLGISVAYMCSALDGRAGLTVFYLLFVLVVIVFSGEGALSYAGIFRHPLFAYLGRISLPMYVTQTLFRRIVPWYFGKSSQWMQCVLIYFGIFVFSVFLQEVLVRLHRKPVLRTSHA